MLAASARARCCALGGRRPLAHVIAVFTARDAGTVRERTLTISPFNRALHPTAPPLMAVACLARRPHPCFTDHRSKSACAGGAHEAARDLCAFWRDRCVDDRRLGTAQEDARNRLSCGRFFRH